MTNHQREKNMVRAWKRESLIESINGMRLTEISIQGVDSSGCWFSASILVSKVHVQNLPSVSRHWAAAVFLLGSIGLIDHHIDVARLIRWPYRSAHTRSACIVYGVWRRNQCGTLRRFSRNVSHCSAILRKTSLRFTAQVCNTRRRIQTRGAVRRRTLSSALRYVAVPHEVCDTSFVLRSHHQLSCHLVVPTTAAGGHTLYAAYLVRSSSIVYYGRPM